MSNITETLKAKLDELDLDRRLDELTEATEQALKRGLERAGDLAHDNRDKVTAFLDKAASTANEKTEGKYAETITKVRGQVVEGVDKLAAKRPTHTPGTPQDSPAPTAPTTPSAQGWAGQVDEV
ncbi:MAG TPA: antitoxin [Dermatophilaceae bacterium]|nr:antitoxin [Dermatophilaceae bacterium]